MWLDKADPAEFRNDHLKSQSNEIQFQYVSSTVIFECGRALRLHYSNHNYVMHKKLKWLLVWFQIQVFMNRLVPDEILLLQRHL